MFGTRIEVVRTLRSMALRDSKPSEMLRGIISHCAPEVPDQNLLVQYFSEAFCFSDGQAYPIFGWLPDGTGELSDCSVDYLLSKRIRQTKAEWENS